MLGTPPATKVCARSAPARHRSCASRTRSRGWGAVSFRRALAPGEPGHGQRRRAAAAGRAEQSFGARGSRLHADASIGIALFPPALPATRSACSSAPMWRCTRPSGCAPATRFTSPPATATAVTWLPPAIGELHGGAPAATLVLHHQAEPDPRNGGGGHGRRGAGALGPPGRRGRWSAHFLLLVEQSGLTRVLTTFVLDRALDEIGKRRPALPTTGSTSGRPTYSTSACRRRSSGCWSCGHTG